MTNEKTPLDTGPLHHSNPAPNASEHCGLVAVPFSQVDHEEIDFLLPGLPLGMISVLAGNPGLGKSMLKASWAAQVSAGTNDHDPSGVILLDAEDLPGVIADRLTAAGADVNRVHCLQQEGDVAALSFPDDLDELERMVEAVGAKLVVLDPAESFISASIDTWKDASTRRLLTPLGDMARRRNLAVVLVKHLTKTDRPEVLHRVGGSMAFGGVARSIFMLERDPHDPDGELGKQRVLLHVKSNIEQLRETEVLRIQSDGRAPQIVSVGYSPLTPGEVFELNAKRGRKSASKLEKGMEIIQELLADGRAHPRADVIHACNESGVSESTALRAARTLAVNMGRENTARPGTLWSLPVTSAVIDVADGSTASPADTQPEAETVQSRQGDIDVTEQPEIAHARERLRGRRGGRRPGQYASQTHPSIAHTTTTNGGTS